MMVVRGVAIGAIISAPMGPVGILCVQRTLDGGRRHGFYTGVGASISDLIYCLLTGFGLSFIEDFLQENQQIIQILGSIVLIGFGIYIMKKNPASNLSRKRPSAGRTGKAMLSGFLFTFSNPLILFLIIGLFARFNFQSPECRWFDYVVGYISIVAGAIGWWWLITFIVNKVRAHFNLRSMWIVNRVIGIVILIFALFGIITAFTSDSKASVRPEERIVQQQIWHPVSDTLPVLISAPGPEAGRFCFLPGSSEGEAISGIDFTLSNLHGSPERAYSYIDEEGNRKKRKRPAILLKWTTASGRNGSLRMASELPLTYESEESGGQTGFFFEGELVPETGSKPLNFILDETPFHIDVHNGKMTISIAREREFTIVLDEDLALFDIEVEPGGNLAIGSGQYWTRRLPVYNRRVSELDWNDQESIGQSVLAITGGRTVPEVCGVWRHYQSREDTGRISRGGDYRLLILPSDTAEGGLDIWMIDGARVLPDEWPCGRLKGRLKPSAWADDWEAEWYDAEGRSCGRAVRAHYKDGVLEILFPRHGSSVSFIR